MEMSGLNWTEEQVQAHIARARAGWTTETAAVDPRKVAKPIPVHKCEPRMNSWETSYAYALDLQRMAGLIRGWRFEPWKFILAPKTTYRPDFVVWMADGTVQVHEVKGFMREDAAIKIKVASEMNPWFRFFVVKKEGDGWELTEVGK
jgi:hypothetical protein